MSTTSKYTVIGAGHGGKAMAAHLALMGFPRDPVQPHPRTRGGHQGPPRDRPGELRRRPARLRPAGGRHVGHGRGVGRGRGGAWSSCLLRPTPRSPRRPHRTCAMGRSSCCIPAAPWAPSSSTRCSATRAARPMSRSPKPSTFIYASRSDGPAQARIFRIKEAVPLAALPATRTAQVLEALAPAYPQFIDGINVLHTGLDNMGAIFHPALTLLNAGPHRVDPRRLRVLHRGRDAVGGARAGGAGPGAGDRGGLAGHPRADRPGVAARWPTTPNGEDLNEAIHNQPGYYGIKAPSTLNHRYIFEDVPMSLVPIAALGQHYRRLGARDGCDHPPGVHHPPHRLLAPRPDAGQAGHRPAQRRRTDAVR